MFNLDFKDSNSKFVHKRLILAPIGVIVAFIPFDTVIVSVYMSSVGKVIYK